MSEELQSESDVIETPEVVETEHVAEIETQSSESAPDSQNQDEQTVDSAGINQEAVNKRISEMHFKAKEAERKAQELERQLQQYQQVNDVAPVVPTMPDEFDDNFAEKMQERDKAIEAKARFDAEQAVRQQAEQQKIAEQQMAQQAKLQQVGEKYVSRATELGVSSQELQTAANTIAAYGMSDDMALHIASDDSGPLITKYLAANPSEVVSLQGMTPYQAAIHLEQNIKPAANQLKPKTTAAPAPATKVEGGSVDPDLGKYQHVNGGFE